MANDRNDNLDGQEESEYHFSDDQMNYETEESTSQPEKPKPTGMKEKILAKIAGNRRIVIISSIAVVVVFFIYKMIAPSSNSQGGEIAATQMKASQSLMAAQKKMSVKQSVPMTPQPAEAPSQPEQASLQPQITVNAAPPVPVAPTQPVSTNAPMNNAPTDIRTILDKLAALEQQNTKLSYELETDFPQKLAATAEQNAALQTKVQDLTARIASVETALTQLTQTLQGGVKQPPAAGEAALVPPPPVAKPEPKINYTVQAIIPGRAWLKADTGETVTVAEGDLLKDFGRISRIDPYDGVVDIDVGNRVVTLTYGGGS